MRIFVFFLFLSAVALGEPVATTKDIGIGSVKGAAIPHGAAGVGKARGDAFEKYRYEKSPLRPEANTVSPGSAKRFTFQQFPEAKIEFRAVKSLQWGELLHMQFGAQVERIARARPYCVGGNGMRLLEGDRVTVSQDSDPTRLEFVIKRSSGAVETRYLTCRGAEFGIDEIKSVFSGILDLDERLPITDEELGELLRQLLRPQQGGRDHVPSGFLDELPGYLRDSPSKQQVQPQGMPFTPPQQLNGRAPFVFPPGLGNGR